MKPVDVPSTKRDQEGIALIIVLGLLAVLVIFGVSFSISMRTERLATRSYIDVVKARHLVHTALARVMSEHINAEMKGVAYPPWDAFSIQDGTTNRLDILGDQSMTSAMVFVSMSLRPAADAADGLEWQELRDPIDDKILYGEYAFMVVNNSGLLDANVIGNTNSLRLRGTNAAEVMADFNVLPELERGISTNALHRYREGFSRFESVPELYYLTSTPVFDANFGPKPLVTKAGGASGPLDGHMADHLHVFSRLPLGFANDNLTANPKVAYIGGKPSADWVRDINEAIMDISDETIPDKLGFARTMYDFADNESYEPFGDNETEKFARISSKAVPMINEINVRHAFVVKDKGAPAAGVTHRVYVEVEVWYPFIQSDPDNPLFEVEYVGIPSVRVLAAGASYPAFQPDQAYSKKTGRIRVENITQPNTYKVVTNIFESAEQDVVLGGGPGGPRFPVPMRIFVTFPQGQSIRVFHQGQPVDVVYTEDMALPARPGNLGGFAVDEEVDFPHSVSMQVNDPRINWTLPGTGFRDSAKPWVMAENSGSLGKFNQGYAKGPVDEIDANGNRVFMYARRNPFNSLGDIGYLLFHFERPWETVRLIEPDTPEIVKLLDRLRLHQQGEYPRLGVVNLNTRQAPVMAAVFNNSPIEQYPDDPNVTRLSADKANLLADYWVSVIGNSALATNTSDYATRVKAAKFDEILETSDKFTRESIIRNSISLLGARHNLFTIFLAARTFSDKYNPAAHSNVKRDYVTSEQRAVAVVWRDPYITTDGAGNSTAESWVQYFHWFSGAFGD